MHEPVARPRIAAKFILAYAGFGLDVDLDLPGQGISALLGHSGSGKTTILRCIAGLIRTPRGYLAMGSDVWQDESKGVFIPTHKRPIGMVFQEASLFAHLSARNNLSYAMKRAGGGTSAGDLDQVVSLLGIAPLLDRMPGTLSGGERQRVAIARALLTRPRLLLMDEPLASLDLRRKLEIFPYLERLRNELDIPILYVTHSPDEAARLADNLVVMEGGRPIASGPLSDVLTRMDLPPAFTDDTGVVLDVTVGAHEDDDLTRLEFVGGSIHVSRRAEAIGQKLRCRIHARDVSIALDRHKDTSILNVLPATVTDFGATDTPGHILVLLTLGGGTRLLARITERSRRLLGITAGSNVWAQVKAVALLE